MSVRTLVIGFAFAFVLSAVPQIAFADGPASYTDAVAGRELFATPTLGIFAGVATGSLPGSWSASIWHTPLGTAPSSITGGSFALATAVDGSTAIVRGTFSAGTVSQTGGFNGCANQTYAVQALLGQVGVGGGTGSGTVAATLTHYRTAVFGYCVTYKATVVGVVGLVF